MTILDKISTIKAVSNLVVLRSKYDKVCDELACRELEANKSNDLIETIEPMLKESLDKVESLGFENNNLRRENIGLISSNVKLESKNDILKERIDILKSKIKCFIVGGFIVMAIGLYLLYKLYLIALI